MLCNKCSFMIFFFFGQIIKFWYGKVFFFFFFLIKSLLCVKVKPQVEGVARKRVYLECWEPRTSLFLVRPKVENFTKRRVHMKLEIHYLFIVKSSDCVGGKKKILKFQHSSLVLGQVFPQFFIVWIGFFFYKSVIN